MADGAEPGDTPILPTVPEATNTLLLVPGVGTQSRELFLDILTRSPPAKTHVLVVTYTDRPRTWVQAWNDHAGEPPASGGIVAVGQAEEELEDESWRVATVSNHGDLTGTGIELSEMLSQMATRVGEDEQIVMCFDSITMLLQYADLQRAFRFLHVVTGRVRNVDARAYYHMNPGAHDTQAKATLSGLFDALVERKDDDWTVTQ